MELLWVFMRCNDLELFFVQIIYWLTCVFPVPLVGGGGIAEQNSTEIYPDWLLQRDPILVLLHHPDGGICVKFFIGLVVWGQGGGGGGEDCIIQ